MSTTLAPSTARTDVDSDLNHIYCCNPNIAICGTDVSAHPEVDDDINCVVCLDLEGGECDCDEEVIA